MGLRELDTGRAYDSEQHDLLMDFYIPALSQTVLYYRISGYFSSKVLSLAARGISRLISNGGNMLLLTSPELTLEDTQTIEEVVANPDERLTELLLFGIERIENEFQKNHLFALAWMLKNNKLEIRIAIPMKSQSDSSSGLLHEKIGILQDSQGDMISFSGSNNETAAGWLSNIEEFKVFRNWEPTEFEYFRTDLEKFSRLWNGESATCKITPLPQAVADKLLSIAPHSIDICNLERWHKPKQHFNQIPTCAISLTPPQTRAVESWFNYDCQGLFEMATGTGKTFAAIACIFEVLRTMSGSKLITFSAPYMHLLSQWQDSIERFYQGSYRPPIVIADSTNPGWTSELLQHLINLRLGVTKAVFTLTTHSTFSSRLAAFLSEKTADSNIELILVADEVHGLGAPMARASLSSRFSKKLGLSATPRRMFDDEGTQAIFGYFGGVIFEFSLEDAMTMINPLTGLPYLVPFEYHPLIVDLTEDEQIEYSRLSKIITQLQARSIEDPLVGEHLERTLFRRASILKNAENKLSAFQAFCPPVASTEGYILVYGTEKQLPLLAPIIQNKGLRFHEFTYNESPKERDQILTMFSNGEYQLLTAIKCLDEGVDIPAAREIFLLASSLNPRELIQRLGRVLRRAPGKLYAKVHDFIVLPPIIHDDSSVQIMKKELGRFEQIGKLALNSAAVLALLWEIKQRFGR